MELCFLEIALFAGFLNFSFLIDCILQAWNAVNLVVKTTKQKTLVLNYGLYNSLFWKTKQKNKRVKVTLCYLLFGSNNQLN